MKKLILSFAAVAGLLTACNNGTPTASLNDNVDSLSYEAGAVSSQGLKNYLVQQLGVDTAYLDEFFKGVKESIKSGDDKKQAAYFAGIQVGQQVQGMIKNIEMQAFGNDSTKKLSTDNFLAGFIEASSDKLSLKDSKGNTLPMDSVVKMFEKRLETVRASQYKENKTKNEAYLQKVAKESGVKPLADGIYYRVIKAGNGAIPADTATVVINYEGRLIDGTVFDSSYQRKEPQEMNLAAVIPGFKTALSNMPVGSTWEIYIPQNMGYGQREAGVIKPFSTLIFKVELLSIKK